MKTIVAAAALPPAACSAQVASEANSGYQTAAAAQDSGRGTRRPGARREAEARASSFTPWGSAEA